MNMQPRTASDGARAVPDRRFDSWLLDAGYAAFLLLIFVTLSPLAARDAATLAAHAGEGDVLRQIAFLSVFAVIVGCALWTRGFAALRAVPIVLAVTLVWCLASALWSIEPDVTLRRAVLAVVIVVSAMVAVDSVGAERALRMWRVLLIGILVANWVSVFILPEAVHLPGDSETDVIGDWRGLYVHKNIAGAVSAMSAIVFLFSALGTKRWSDWLLFAGSIGFLIMTQSKSSMGFLGLAILAGAFYRLIGRGGLDRMIGVVAAALLLVVGGGFAVANWDAIAHLLQDPMQFTGRAAIWQAEARYVGDHPLLGAGFGSFADTGARSPLYSYMGEKWIGTISHGHSGYLELAVTVGLIGFALAMIALIVQPLVGFARAATRQTLFTTLTFTLFIFVVLHNVMESDFLEGDAPQWVAFLMAIAMVRGHQRETGTREAERWP
jgi:exopolysaccharide production protein ExoQ